MDAHDLKALRKRLGKTQQEIAYYVCRDIRTVRRWEDDAVIPGYAVKLLEMLG